MKGRTGRVGVLGLVKGRTGRLSLIVVVKQETGRLSVLELVKGKRKVKCACISWRKNRTIEYTYVSTGKKSNLNVLGLVKLRRQL